MAPNGSAVRTMVAAVATCAAGVTCFAPAFPCASNSGLRLRGAPQARAACSVAPSMGLDAEIEGKWSKFSEWTATQNIQNEKLGLAEFDTGLRGVKAVSPISSGDVLLSVPVGAVLRVVGGNSRPPSKLQGYVSDETWCDAQWWGQLALLLLWEKGVGRAKSIQPSSMASWIEMLPEDMNTPLHWTEAQVEELQYQPLVTKCIRQRTAWKVLFKQVQKDNAQICQDDFYLACEMARSRAFSGPFVNRLPKDQIFLTGLLVAVSTQLNILDATKAAIGTALVLLWVVGNALVVPRIFGLTHYVMAPMIDMVNHNGMPGGAAGVTYQALQATFEVLSTKPYSKGDQVFISYGERSNDQLLQYYGFVEADNANDVYEFENIARRLADACSKLSITAVGLDGYASSNPAPTLLAPTGFDPTFMSDMDKMCSGEAQARKVLSSLLQEELGKYATSLEADERAFEALSKSSDARTALTLMLRVEKKRLLAKNIATLSR